MDLLVDSFLNSGFCKGQLISTKSLKLAKKYCSKFVNDKLGKEIPLEQYHQFVTEAEHRNFHYDLTQYLRSLDLHKVMIEENMELFSKLIGSDIDIQAEFYLRISRPNEASDNIGMHRDTSYGNSAYEMSTIFPLVDFVEGSAVGLIPNSHKYGELEIEQIPHKTIKKGSKQNQLGFLYSTKKIKKLDHTNIVWPLVKFGEFLSFSLGIIHGQVINSSSITRWSIDFRLRNHFAPLNINLKDGYYVPLCSSPVTQIADVYYQSSVAEKLELTTAPAVNQANE